MYVTTTDHSLDETSTGAPESPVDGPSAAAPSPAAGPSSGSGMS